MSELATVQRNLPEFVAAELARLEEIPVGDDAEQFEAGLEQIAEFYAMAATCCTGLSTLRAAAAVKMVERIELTLTGIPNEKRRKTRAYALAAERLNVKPRTVRQDCEVDLRLAKLGTRVPSSHRSKTVNRIALTAKDPEATLAAYDAAEKKPTTRELEAQIRKEREAEELIGDFMGGSPAVEGGGLTTEGAEVAEDLTPEEVAHEVEAGRLDPMLATDEAGCPGCGASVCCCEAEREEQERLAAELSEDRERAEDEQRRAVIGVDLAAHGEEAGSGLFLPAELAAKIERLAELRGMTVGEALEWAVDMALAEAERPAAAVREASAPAEATTPATRERRPVVHGVSRESLEMLGNPNVIEPEAFEGRVKDRPIRVKAADGAFFMVGADRDEDGRVVEVRALIVCELSGDVVRTADGREWCVRPFDLAVFVPREERRKGEVDAG